MVNSTNSNPGQVVHPTTNALVENISSQSGTLPSTGINAPALPVGVVPKTIARLQQEGVVQKETWPTLGNVVGKRRATAQLCALEQDGGKKTFSDTQLSKMDDLKRELVFYKGKENPLNPFSTMDALELETEFSKKKANFLERFSAPESVLEHLGDFLKGWTDLSKIYCEYTNAQKPTCIEKNGISVKRNASLIDKWYREAVNRNAKIKRAFPQKGRAVNAEGRFSGPATLDELGIRSIVDHAYFLPLAAQNQSFSNARLYRSAYDAQAPLIPYKKLTVIKDQSDIAKLTDRWAQSPCPFLVIGIPGIEDGTEERTVIFVKLLSQSKDSFGNSYLETGMLAKNAKGEAVLIDPYVPHLGQAKNLEEIVKSANIVSPFFETVTLKRKTTDSFSREGNFICAAEPLGKLPSNLHAYDKFLKDSLAGGRSQASFVVMTPQVPAIQVTAETIKKLGYDVDYQEVDPFTDIAKVLQNIGCDVERPHVDETRKKEIKDGKYDRSTCDQILFIHLPNHPPYSYLWKSGLEDMAFNLNDNNVYKFTPSQLLMSVPPALLQPEYIQHTLIHPNEFASIIHNFTGIDPRKAQLMMHRKQEELGVDMNSTVMLAYLLREMKVDFKFADYDLGSLDEPKNAQLGKLLDESQGTILVEYEREEIRENTNEKGESWTETAYDTTRVCFKQPGTSTANLRLGIVADKQLKNLSIAPSELLDQLRVNEDESTTKIRVISTAPLQASIVDDEEEVPENIQDICIGLQRVGVLTGGDPVSEQRSLYRFVRGNYGGDPMDITSGMIMEFSHEINRGLKEEEKLTVKRRLNTSRPLELPPDPSDHLVYVYPDARFHTISFHKEDEEFYFDDFNGQPIRVSEIEKIAEKDAWRRDAPIEILHFKRGQSPFASSSSVSREGADVPVENSEKIPLYSASLSAKRKRPSLSTQEEVTYNPEKDDPGEDTEVENEFQSGKRRKSKR